MKHINLEEVESLMFNIYSVLYRSEVELDKEQRLLWISDALESTNELFHLIGKYIDDVRDEKPSQVPIDICIEIEMIVQTK